MSRLIDDDELIKTVEKSMKENPHNDSTHKGCHVHEHNHFLCMIAKQPTAYDPKEVVRQLEVQKAIAFITLANTSDAALDASYRNVISYLDRAIEIVRKGGVK